MSPSPYAVALELTALSTVWLGLGAWQNDRQWPGRGCFLGLTVALAVWSFGGVLGDRELVAHFSGEKVRYLGMMAVPALWFGLGAQAMRLAVARHIPWFPLALMVPSACLYLLFHLGPWTGLFVRPDGVGSTAVGPLWPVYLGYSWLLVLGGSGLMVIGALKRVEAGRSQRQVLFVAAAIAPLIMPTLALLTGERWIQDPAPVLLGLALVALRGALFRGGVFDAVPIDQRDLMRHLQIGLVIADASGAVIDLNPAAERCLGIPHAQALDRNLEAVLAQLAHEVPVEIQPIMVGGRLKGSCAVIADATPRQLAA